MNPLNHTPGPWAFSLNHSGDYQLRGSNGHLVMQISTGTIPDNSDARLIASAPDLLRALQRLVLEVESICAHEAGAMRDVLIERLHKDWDGKILDSRLAISKAKGQE